MKVKIGNKGFKLEVAESDEDRIKGLSNRKELAEDNGMLFVYDDEDERSFHMKDTFVPLDVAFLDNGGVIQDIKEGVPENLNAITGHGRYVVEVPKGSGLNIGDILDIDDDEIALFAGGGQMKVLDEKGDVQMEIEGGERIVSRKETKTLIEKAKAAKSDKSDASYASLGKYIASVFGKQDGRDQEYV